MGPPRLPPLLPFLVLAFSPDGASALSPRVVLSGRNQYAGAVEQLRRLYSSSVPRPTPSLRARRSDYEDDLTAAQVGRSIGGGRRQKQKKKNYGSKGGRRGKYEEDEEEAWDWPADGGGDDDDTQIIEDGADAEPFARGLGPDLGDDYRARAKAAADALRATAESIVREGAWDASLLDAEKTAPTSCWGYRSELRDAVDRVGANLVEREGESRLVVLGMVSGEHVLLLGPPGTGKSALGRRLSRLCGGLFFQRLLTRFTTPEEIFGPLSLRALENDEYRRVTDGFLPTATVAFLDEIFKANSAILNTLLTILNERQFDNGGGAREDCPIRCVVGASNELPESDELDALYDRFLLRREVLPVSDEGLVTLLSAPTTAAADITPLCETDEACDAVFLEGLDRVVDKLSAAADAVVVGDDVAALLRDLRTYVRNELNEEISDRRLVRASRLLRISAACHGRGQVDMLDCLLLQHVAWRVPEERAAVREWLWENLTPGCGGMGGPASAEVRQYRFLLDGLKQEATSVVRTTGGDVTGAGGGRPLDVAATKAIRTEAARIVELLQRRSASLARHAELLRRSADHLWVEADEAKAAQQMLLPTAKAAVTEINQAMSDAVALRLALSDGESAPPDNVRLSVIDMLWEAGTGQEIRFTSAELEMGMKQAKSKYDAETFRAWKRARKKVNAG